MATVWPIRFEHPAHKLFVLKLADECNDDGRFGYPDLTAYEQQVGMTASDMASLLHLFVQTGAVRVVHSTQVNSSALRTTYQLWLDRLPAPAVDPGPSVPSLVRYRVLLEAHRFFRAKFQQGVPVWRRRLKRWHSRFDVDYTVELTRDLRLRVVDLNGREVVRSESGRFDRLDSGRVR